MMNFKTFLLEQKDEKDMVREIHHLPLHNSHEGVAETANALEDTHEQLLGKKGSIPKHIDQEGVPINFGVNKKQFFIDFYGKRLTSFDDIDQNFEDPNLNKMLKQAATSLPSILPRHSKFYGGKLIPIDDKKLGISLETDHRGNPLKDKDRAQFKSSGNIQIIDNSVKVDPSNYSPEEQNQFLMHMNNARKTYSRMDPDAFDNVKGYEGKIKNYIKQKDITGEKHSVEDFVNDLMMNAQGKAARRKKDNVTMESSDNVLKKHGEDVNHILQNEKTRLETKQGQIDSQIFGKERQMYLNESYRKKQRYFKIGRAHV